MIIKNNWSNLTKAILLGSMVTLFAALTPSLSIAASGDVAQKQFLRTDNPESYEAKMNRILSVLEDKMEGQRLPEKTKDKLSTLNDKQIQLLDSLAVRMSHSANTTASDFAFFLITTLIILS